MTHFSTALARAQWRGRQEAHRVRVDKLTREHLKRRTRGQRHPVWDFLFEYYPVTPGKLAHWSPGHGATLSGATAEDVAHLKFYRVEGDQAVFDYDAYLEKRGHTVAYIRDLFAATQTNPTHFDCFGLHEWAMVYGDQPSRHPEPLRLGRAGTNAVVESHQVKCTHYDAFRFFTEPAAPLNLYQPSRDTQPEHEQAGCLHANMDLYKWATKLGELVPGELWLDSFELASDIRRLDMEASPYDLQEWGFTPVPVETAAGKAEYVERQRSLASRAATVRNGLLAIADDALATLH